MKILKCTRWTTAVAVVKGEATALKTYTLLQTDDCRRKGITVIIISIGVHSKRERERERERGNTREAIKIHKDSCSWEKTDRKRRR